MFGLYIFAFYLGALLSGQMDAWNNNLSGLYSRGDTISLGAMAAHLVMGAIVLLIGPMQLMTGPRQRWPGMHRWLGRVYVVASGLAGLGGLAFILIKGTIGGPVMNLGFGLYGALMLLASIQAWRYAVARKFDEHREWAVRLFALAIGSWLYRMDYGFWLLAMHRLGHLESFRGPFDMIMAFFFYLPNLAVAEVYLRARRLRANGAMRAFAVVTMALASLVVAVGTYYFARFYWGPGILDALKGKFQ